MYSFKIYTQILISCTKSAQLKSDDPPYKNAELPCATGSFKILLSVMMMSLNKY